MWTASDWRRRWPGLVALAVLIALAGGVATALAAGARRADTSYARFQDATHASNLVAPVNLETLQETDQRYVEELDALAAIDGVEGVIAESWWAIAVYPERDPPGVVNAFSIAPLATVGTIDEAIVLDGELPGLDDPNTIVINDVAVEELGLSVGDTLTMRTASPARLAEWAGNDGQFGSTDALDGPIIDVRVAAVTRTDDDLGEERFPVISFTEAFAQAHVDDIANVVPAIALRADPARIDEVAAAAEAVLAPYGIGVIPPPDLGATVEPSLRVEATTMWAAAAIAAAAGVLLVAQAVGRQMAATAADNPARRALGMTGGQLAFGGALGVAPAVIGGSALVPAVAWSASWLFPRGVARLAEPTPGLRLDLSAVLVGAVATAVVVLVTATVLAMFSARSRHGAPTSRHRLAGWLIGRPSAALGASFAGDPVGTGGRSRIIAAATAAGIAVGVGGLVAVAVLDASRSHLNATPRLYGAPTELYYESNGTFGIDELVATTLSTPGVTEVTRHPSINDFSVPATGPGGTAEVEPSAYVTERGGALPPMAAGRHPQGSDEVALGSATAARLGAEIDDIVTIDAPDGRPVELRVSGIIVSWENNDSRNGFVVGPDALRQVLCPDDAPEECDVSVNVFASAEDSDAAEALRALGYMEVDVPATVQRVEQVGPIPWYLAGFLCLLGAVGLAHGVVTAQRRRGRDLAIVRAMGLPADRAAASLTWQAGLTAVIGAAAGVVLGAIVGPWLWQVIAEDLGVVVDPQLPVVVVLVVLVGALGVAVTLSLLPRWRSAHVSAAEGLRAE